MPSLTNLAILGHTPRFRLSFSRLTLNHSSVICELIKAVPEKIEIYELLL